MSLTWDKYSQPCGVTLLVPPVHSDHCPACAGFSSNDWCQASAHSVQSVLVPHLMPVIEPLRLNRCRPAHQPTQLPWMASQPVVTAGAVIVPAWCPSSNWYQAGPHSVMPVLRPLQLNRCRLAHQPLSCPGRPASPWLQPEL